MNQLLTSFYCPHCEGKGQKKEGGGVDIGWKFIGNVLHIELGVDSVTIEYRDTKSVKDRVWIDINHLEGIDKITTGIYPQNSFHLYKHTLAGDMFKIAGVGIK
jgi:hypothetical protein